LNPAGSRPQTAAVARSQPSNHKRIPRSGQSLHDAFMTCGDFTFNCWSKMIRGRANLSNS